MSLENRLPLKSRAAADAMSSPTRMCRPTDGHRLVWTFVPIRPQTHAEDMVAQSPLLPSADGCSALAPAEQRFPFAE